MPLTTVPSGPLLLGVDGGGSKTTAVIATATAAGDFQTLGRASGGPCNPRSVGAAAAEANLRSVTDAARAAAALPTGRTVDAACFAIAGTGRAAEQRWLENAAHKLLPTAQLAIVHDALPLLAAATDSAWGVAVIAGTGSLAYGCTLDGHTARAGGWGALFGDEGSGYWMAVQALRAYARAADGRGPRTLLTPRLQSRLQIEDPDQLIAAVYDAPLDRSRIAALAPTVVEAADAGDQVAEKILDEAAASLAEMAATVARQLRFASASYPLAVTGGVLLHSESLRIRLLQQLDDCRCTPAATILVHEPTEGALRLARNLLPS